MVAVNDGIIRKLGSSPKLGKFVVLEDTYGNRYTYAELGRIVRDHRSVVMPTGQGEAAPGRHPEPAAAAAGAARRASRSGEGSRDREARRQAERAPGTGRRRRLGP